MDVTALQPRWTVVVRLQERRAKVVPGSRDEQIIERAIDLALSDQRTQQDPEYLYRDVMRNATFAHDRAVRRFREVLSRLGADSAFSNDEDASDIIDTCTPDQAVEATELYHDLHTVAVKLGPHGQPFLEQILSGKRPTEAAIAVGISRATAYRFFATLRRHADRSQHPVA